MKRSEVNTYLKEAVAFFDQHGFKLPEWAFWTPSQWAEKPDFAKHIKSLQMGWDITDFGSGEFEKHGLLLFCIRNGKTDKNYAEKIMVVRDKQVTPLHFHFQKQEDIINRGGGNLVLELFHSDEKGGLKGDPVTVRVDEFPQRAKAGDPVVLKPGQSVTLPTKLYHTFYGQDGHVVVGEVSDVNDDHTDNRFYKKSGRFPKIEEDEAAVFPLWTEVAD